MPRGHENEVTLVLGGEAGQGIQTLETIITRTMKLAGLHVFATKEYMSRVRGGSNSATIRAASGPARAHVERIDVCVLLDRAAHAWLANRITPKTLLIGDPTTLGDIDGLLTLPLAELARQAGDKILANGIAGGFVSGLLGLPLAPLETTLREFFADKGRDPLERNLHAARLGWDRGRAAAEERQLEYNLATDPDLSRRLFLTGTQAVGLGAIAGGCDFIASYPMSPGTGVLQFLAQYAERFGIVVEQAEDEIAAINMGLGSWYAGGRAMVSTSGGGFALMEEGLSLAGAIESPMVIHLAQRPGPATGLPTRTEQGDLDLALYAGHGEFPRAILAPGTLGEAFRCAEQAFALADASQCPVFVLTDQYLLDSGHDLAALPLPAMPPEPRIVATGADYRRYAAGDNGLSPRGIPGHGQGLVRVDSDEHDESGFITERAEVRLAMVDKRLKKIALLRDFPAFPTCWSGPANPRRLIVGWGSTRAAVEEALARVADPATACLYCAQVYPLPEAFKRHLLEAPRLIVIENNATGQLARLIQRETGRRADVHWLRYDGRPFSVEDVANRLRREVNP